MANKVSDKLNFVSYSAKGMHCASCELLIEKKILALDGIKSVEASTNKGVVQIGYKNGKKPSAKKLNNIFEKDGYQFFDLNEKTTKDKVNWSDYLNSGAIAAVVILAFIILSNSGFSGLVSISEKSSLPVFFLFGILAGCSTCAALVGGIVLSMSKTWKEKYSANDNNMFGNPIAPHLLFNFGRIISFTLLGGLLGAVGSRFQLSFGFTSALILIISIAMFILGLQMLGVKTVTFSLPKQVTRFSSNENNFAGKYGPLLMGSATFLLPCGFTMSAEGIALLSGSIFGGALIMLAFALGTAIPLLAIGLSSLKFFENKTLAGNFSRVAGILVIFFALFNINNQLNFWGLPSFSNLSSTVQIIGKNSINTNNNNKDDKDLPPLENGKQILKMSASSTGYIPNVLKVRSGIPVVWQITDTGTSGCTNAILARDFLKEPIQLTPGKMSTVEFTPTSKGTFRFSCWMGMVNGTIEVI